MLLGALVALPTETSAIGTDDPIVEAIEIRTDGSLDAAFDGAEALRDLLAVDVGDRLTRDAVRRTLSNVHAAGRFRSVELLRTPGSSDDRVVVVLVLEPPLRIVDVDLEIVGEGPRLRGAVRPTLTELEGGLFEESIVFDATEAVRERFLARGFFEAEARPKVVERDDGRGVDVLLAVDPGPRARVAGVELEPLGSYELTPASLETLRAALRTRSGRPYSRDRLEVDQRRLTKRLRSLGRPTARVDTPLERYDFDASTVTLVFPFDPGPRVEVEVRGVPRKTLASRDLLPPRPDDPLDEASISRACERIVDDFQSRGFARAEARCELTDQGDTRRIAIDVVPGPELELVDVRFVGNERVDDATLRELIETSIGPSTAIARMLSSSGRLDPAALDEDLANLRSYYLLQGFSEVRVGPARIVAGDEVGGRTDRAELARVEIPIVEGPQRRVVQLDLEGVAALDEARLLEALPLRPGGPYHPVLLDDSMDVLRTLYEEEGYAAARVVPTLDWSPDGTLVDVELTVAEGPPRAVDRILLRGHDRTRSGFVRRIADLDPGEPISRRRLLRAERDLYRLGVFSRVDVELVPTADPRATTRDVLIDLEEGRRWRVAYGLSYHSDDGIGGLFGVTRSNLFGRGARLQLDLRGSVNDQRARLVYDQPVIGSLQLPFTASIFARSEDRGAFDVREAGTQLQLTRDFARSRLGLVYDYRLVKFSEEPLDLTDLDREDSAVEISSITPTLFIDRRDDPIDPTRGLSVNAQLQYAFRFLAADAAFVKLFAQHTRYQPVGPLGVLAGSLRLGAIEPLDSSAALDSLVPDGLASAEVPISERFFAGGRTTHRAYERDALGLVDQSLLPTDDGRILELGGNALALLNLDWRFPLVGELGGVVFFDYGQVWADYRDADVDDLRAGAGLGLRYASPVGPVRFEIGWKLDPGPLEGNEPVFYFSFGNPF